MTHHNVAHLRGGHFRVEVCVDISLDILDNPFNDVTFDGAFGAGTISVGAGADTLVFLDGASVGSSASVNMSGGADSLQFLGNLVSGSFAGGTGTDSFSGSISVGASGVSFWGGTGNDTFAFTGITGSGAAAGTAYFWNESGTDSLTFTDNGFTNQVTLGFGGSAQAVFGVSSGSSVAALDISFGASQGTGVFGATDGSSGFYIGSGGNTLVSLGFGNTSITVVWTGGATATLQGGDFETVAGTAAFSNVTVDADGVGLFTGNFGTAAAIPTFS